VGDLLQDLAFVMVFAAFAAVVCNRLRQPAVLGYLLAGLVIGPHVGKHIWTVSHPDNISTLANIGVVMLMFGLGLQFSLGRLIKVVPTAMTAATLEIILMVWIGYQAGQVFGWSKIQSLFLGAMLLSSSTIIIVKTLNDLDLSRERFAETTFGILILEDIYAVLAIVLVTGLVAAEAFTIDQVVHVGTNMGIFLTVTAVIGLIFVPHLLRYVANTRSDEILLVTVLGLGFGIALLGVKLGYTAALGAFVIGAIVAETRMAGKIIQQIEPIRSMFNAIFFVAVGMMVDPAAFVEYWPHILLITGVVVAGKILTGALGSLVAGHDMRTSLRVGLTLAQIGEFAFVIGHLGLMLKAIPESLFSIIVGVSALTTLLTPWLIKYSNGLAAIIEKPVPFPIRDMLAVYHRWFHRGAKNPMYAPVKKLVRKTILQIILNLVLMAAIFGVAAFLISYTAPWWPQTVEWTIVRGSTFWLLASAACMPLVAATMRKLRAMAMLLSELSITPTLAGPRTKIYRIMFVNTIIASGILGLAMYILLLSSAIMPPWPILAIMLVGLAIFTRYRWNAFIQIYAAAQAEIGDTLFAHDPLHEEQETAPPARPMPALLVAAELEMVAIPEHSPVAGKFLREAELRTQTGASVVGIERNGDNIVNPSPDEEVQVGDNVLLLGTKAQLAAARKMISPPLEST